MRAFFFLLAPLIAKLYLKVFIICWSSLFRHFYDVSHWLAWLWDISYKGCRKMALLTVVRLEISVEKIPKLLLFKIIVKLINCWTIGYLALTLLSEIEHLVKYHSLARKPKGKPWWKQGTRKLSRKHFKFVGTDYPYARWGGLTALSFACKKK